MTLLEDAAAFAERCTATSLRSDVVTKAKAHILDTLGAIVVADPDGTARVAACIDEWGGGLDQPGDMALFGAAAADSSGISDFDEATRTHPGSVIVPALLGAVRLSMTRSAWGDAGSAVVAAAVVGYEVMLRLARLSDGAVLRRRGLHPTSFWGLLGGAAAVAHARGGGRAQIGASLGLAASLAGGVSQPGGSEAFRNLQVGWAAKGAVAAACMAAAGYRPSPSVLEHRSGLIRGLAGAEPSEEQIGEAFRAEAGAYLGTVGVTRHVHFTDLHAATDALMAAIDALAPETTVPEGIAEIDAFVPSAMLPAADDDDLPGSPTAARRSLRFSLAAVACHYGRGGRFDPFTEAFSSAGLEDQRVRAAARMVRLHALDLAAAASGTVARVVVKGKDGTSVEHTSTGYWGDGRVAEQRWGWDEVAERFAYVTQSRLPSDEQDACIETVRTLDTGKPDDVAALLSTALRGRITEYSMLADVGRHDPAKGGPCPS